MRMRGATAFKLDRIRLCLIDHSWRVMKGKELLALKYLNGEKDLNFKVITTIMKV